MTPYDSRLLSKTMFDFTLLCTILHEPVWLYIILHDSVLFCMTLFLVCMTPFDYRTIGPKGSFFHLIQTKTSLTKNYSVPLPSKVTNGSFIVIKTLKLIKSCSVLFFQLCLECSTLFNNGNICWYLLDFFSLTFLKLCSTLLSYAQILCLFH